MTDPIRDAIKQFPPRFCLELYPGKTFRLEPSACYMDDGLLILWASTFNGTEWVKFARGTVAELRRNIVYIN